MATSGLYGFTILLIGLLLFSVPFVCGYYASKYAAHFFENKNQKIITRVAVFIITITIIAFIFATLFAILAND